MRCHKSRIDKVFDFQEKDGKMVCACGQVVGIDKGSFFKMVKKGFTYSGTKIPK